jgi:hypothetical protein
MQKITKLKDFWMLSFESHGRYKFRTSYYGKIISMSITDMESVDMIKNFDHGYKKIVSEYIRRTRFIYKINH